MCVVSSLMEAISNCCLSCFLNVVNTAFAVWLFLPSCTPSSMFTLHERRMTSYSTPLAPVSGTVLIPETSTLTALSSAALLSRPLTVPRQPRSKPGYNRSTYHSDWMAVMSLAEVTLSLDLSAAVFSASYFFETVLTSVSPSIPKSVRLWFNPQSLSPLSVSLCQGLFVMFLAVSRQCEELQSGYIIRSTSSGQQLAVQLSVLDSLICPVRSLLSPF